MPDATTPSGSPKKASRFPYLKAWLGFCVVAFLADLCVGMLLNTSIEFLAHMFDATPEATTQSTNLVVGIVRVIVGFLIFRCIVQRMLVGKCYRPN